MNVAELIETTADYLDDPKHTRFKRPPLLRALNSAQRSLKRKIEGVDPDFFQAIAEFAVVSDSDSYEFTLPTDFVRAVQVERLDSGNTPIPMTKVPFQQRFDGTDTRFLPAGFNTGGGYYIRGQVIGVPNPTEAYTMRLVYNKSLTALVDDITISEIPLDYHDLLCLEAAKYSFGGTQHSMSSDLDELRKEGMQDMLLFVEDRGRTGQEFVEVMD
jgi:hypothetical protein